MLELRDASENAYRPITGFVLSPPAGKKEKLGAENLLKRMVTLKEEKYAAGDCLDNLIVDDKYYFNSGKIRPEAVRTLTAIGH